MKILITSRSDAPYRLFNIGTSMQSGDVPATFADVSALIEWTGFRPATDLNVGVAEFVDWYRDYYNEKA